MARGADFLQTCRCADMLIPVTAASLTLGELAQMTSESCMLCIRVVCFQHAVWEHIAVVSDAVHHKV